MYNWQRPQWPDFVYNLSDSEDLLLSFAEETGNIAGILQVSPESVKTENLLDIMVAEAIKTSEIEGEFISRIDVVSSIRNNLGLNISPQFVKDKRALGLSALMIDVRKTYADLLTEEKLFEWHIMLLGQNQSINSGKWRKGTSPMQVISGTVGKEKIHFEAPPSAQLPQEMKRFIQWFNETAPGGSNEIRKAPVRSAIAHLFFESIHPFEDGNGRIGRVLAEKSLSQTMGRPVILSLSRKIETDRKAYYNALENAQHSTDITAWIHYFTQTLLDAQIEAKKLLNFTLQKTNFFDQFKNIFNERQAKAIRKMLEPGPDGFQGGMTAKKYMSITKTSKATATRDLQNLVEIRALKVGGGGRNVSYSLPI
ncbi:Fic family protein [Dyadobacter frigoris]|uniref:Fic family protein n=1 Tax=Dyadobacter frigoris TaxID=2576211 RepID=A0A4U6CZZ5_9BACT|nr:Fic family protein [Dyadobacter frigoris]TKT89391.1 Fic family protein [Dyadobacter frigoris]GLU55469.1 cell division protein Fic [Dyadobacter frigoris]